MRNDVQAIGICRWSYPSDSRGFRRTDANQEDTRRRLYAPERLEHRLFLLKHVMLPALRHQTDPDFTLIFLMGDQLPEPWRGRLLELIGTVPQIRPVFAEEGRDQFDVCRTAIDAVRRDDVAATAQFRLDDDDAVSVHFIAKARRLFALQRPLFAQHGLLGLDFCRGFVFRADARRCGFSPVSMRFWAPGMVLFIGPQHESCVLDFHHLQIWHHMPALTWMNRPMFVRGAHHDNDSGISNLGRRSRTFRFPQHRIEPHMRKHFGIDVPRLRAAWQARKTEFLRAA
ncbi:hypothetical protein DRV85_18645 [Rhodosalinus halophilus]|uniref:Rhamnosyl transferase n=1 Tax=Rhodosalinus halophilus TaxID=2259333 RepID=A0A365U3S9_9RHOB|nr:glycosyltransferase [Rhodosalinus halophilus]RBI82576.1 hypothetical protein DRV85_18645 [Rhodosalinus halophilus]